MIQNKHTGSYYTPKILADFLCSHVFNNYLTKSSLKILEPSCGDGVFVESFCNALLKNNITKYEISLFDINQTELEKAKQHIPELESIKYVALSKDYLRYFLDNKKKYSLIIGNPPYINKVNMEKCQISTCEEVHELISRKRSGMKCSTKINNIWTAFVEASILSLEDHGVICFVIPSEILQVKYTSELRKLISSEFDKVEIFSFRELVFQGIQQDVIALIGVKRVEDISKQGFSFYQVDKVKDLSEPHFTKKHSNIHRISLDKWTNYLISDESLNYIDQLRKITKPVKYYCKNAEVGIVTAANDFFILSDEDISKNNLNRINKIIKPILSKGNMASNFSSFTQNDYEELKAKGKKVNFLQFPNFPKCKMGKIANKYLELGEEKKLHERYKMLKRDHWYHVPSSWVSEGLFVKRSHQYPKIFINEANILATDSFYRVNTKDQYNIKSLVFSFYNSLTFILAELEGRFYGGGVLELTPNEFKNLELPYSANITEKQFKTLDDMLRDKEDIENILHYTNPILLNDVDTIRLEVIRKDLVARRMKVTHL